MIPTPRLALGIAALALFTAGWASLPAQDTTPEVKIHPVAGSVSMLEGKGGNVGVSAGPDGLLMIDDQYAEMAPKLQAAMASLSDKPLRFVINTHWHGDHTGGNAVFAAQAPIVAHSKVRERMSKPAKRRGVESPASPEAALPQLTFDDRVTLHFNGEEVEVLHVGSAHTDGDSVVWFHKSNVVHMGDTFFHQRFPLIDLDSGGSVRGLTREIEKLLHTLPKDVRLIPGHGPLATMEDLQAYHDMLVDVQKLVAQAMGAGKSADAMKKEKLLASHAKLSWQVVTEDAFIDTLVRDAKLR